MEIHEEKLTNTLQLLDCEERKQTIQCKIESFQGDYKYFLKDLMENYCYVCQTSCISCSSEKDNQQTEETCSSKIDSHESEEERHDDYDDDEEDSDDESFEPVETLTVEKNPKSKTSSRAIKYNGCDVLNICSSCYAKSRMSKSTCKKSFFISEAECDNLPHHEKPNPHGRKYAPMKVFNLKNVCMFGFKKFQHGYMDEFQKRNEKRTKWAKKYEDNKSKRLKEIQRELKNKNIDVQEDSPIVKMYVNQRTKNTLQQTIDQLQKNDFLNKRTNFKMCFGQIIYSNKKNGTYENQNTIIEKAEQMAIREWIKKNKHGLKHVPESLKKYLE